MKWIWCRFGLELCLLWICMRVADEKDVDLLVESEWWDSRRESGRERVGVKRERKERKRIGEKLFEGNEHLFAFFVTTSFTPSFPSILSTMPSLSSYAHTHTPHHTITHTHLCAVLFLCVLTICALIPHSIKQTTTPQNPMT